MFLSQQEVFNLPASKLSTFVFKLYKLVGTLVILVMPILLTSAFKGIKSFLAAKSDTSVPVACSNSFSRII